MTKSTSKLTHTTEIYNHNYEKGEITWLRWLPYESGNVGIMICCIFNGKIEFKQEYLK